MRFAHINTAGVVITLLCISFYAQAQVRCRSGGTQPTVEACKQQDAKLGIRCASGGHQPTIEACKRQDEKIGVRCKSGGTQPSVEACKRQDAGNQGTVANSTPQYPTNRGIECPVGMFHDGRGCRCPSGMKMQGNQCVVPNQQTQPQPAPISMGRYPIAGSISQDYGVRWVVNSNKTHTGVDIPAAQGTQVPSMSSGYVAEIRELGGSWGKAVIIQESGGSAKGYLHVNPKVSKGERVSTGQIIGAVWEDHLHYNVCTEVYLCWRGALPTSEPDPNYPNDPLFFNGPFLRP